MKYLLIAALASFATSNIAHASETIRSAKVSVSPSRVVGRVVVQQEGAFSVQILEITGGGSTDVSNTSRLVLSIATFGEMFTNETNLIVDNSRGLISAKMVKDGFIELIHEDADALGDEKTKRSPTNPMEVRRVIDARDAIKAVRYGRCPDFEECEIETSVKIK